MINAEAQPAVAFHACLLQRSLQMFGIAGHGAWPAKAGLPGCQLTGRGPVLCIRQTGQLLTQERLPCLQAAHVSAWLSQPDVPAPPGVVSERSSRQHGLQSPDADALLQVVSSLQQQPALLVFASPAQQLHTTEETKTWMQCHQRDCLLVSLQRCTAVVNMLVYR